MSNEISRKTIEDAMERMNVSSSRGRRSGTGREISVKPTRSETQTNAIARARAYIEISGEIKSMVANYHAGISDNELERAEFIIEMLEDIARNAFEDVISNG